MALVGCLGNVKVKKVGTCRVSGKRQGKKGWHLSDVWETSKKERLELVGCLGNVKVKKVGTCRMSGKRQGKKGWNLSGVWET